MNDNLRFFEQVNEFIAKHGEYDPKQIDYHAEMDGKKFAQWFPVIGAVDVEVRANAHATTGTVSQEYDYMNFDLRMNRIILGSGTGVNLLDHTVDCRMTHSGWIDIFIYQGGKSNGGVYLLMTLPAPANFNAKWEEGNVNEKAC